MFLPLDLIRGVENQAKSQVFYIREKKNEQDTFLCPIISKKSVLPPIKYYCNICRVRAQKCPLKIANKTNNMRQSRLSRHLILSPHTSRIHVFRKVCSRPRGLFVIRSMAASIIFLHRL